MKYVITALLAATAFSAPAFAQGDASGFSFALRTGVSDLNNPTFSITDTETGDRLDTKLETKSAWLVGGKLGYDFGPVRFGLDLSYSRNKVKGLELRSVNGTAITAGDVEDLVDELIAAEIVYPEDLEGAEIDGTTIRATSGSIAKIRQIGVMANLTYDIPVSAVVQPYVGAGLGAIGTHVKALGEDDGSIRFAWQARAGVAFQVTPAIALTADYTYRQTSAGKLQFGDDEIEYRLGKTKASQFTAGLRFTF